jgi:acetyltransferase
LLVILTPQAMTDPTATAEALRQVATDTRRPMLASWMGGPDVAAGEALLNRVDIPTFAYPDTASRAFGAMWRLSRDLQSLYETPVLAAPIDGGLTARDRAAALVERVRRAGRALLTEAESKELLTAYDIPTVETRLAATAEEAIAAAAAIGYPVVVKLNSETITHKTDVGGVRLDLADSDAVRAAFTAIEAAVADQYSPAQFQGVTVQPMVRVRHGVELIVGSSLDAQFGPVLLFGTGGTLVEVVGDRALGLPPLTTTLARRLMEQTRIYRALHGVRGQPPADLAALERLLVRFSQLVVEQPWIREIDINPLVVSATSLVALDARVLLHPAATSPADLPRTAIRPYPTHFVTQAHLRTSEVVTVRPIRPDDEPLMVRFHETLSNESVYLRYFHMLNLSQRVAHERLLRICFNDYDRELALVVEGRDSAGERAILAIGRLSRLRWRNDAEFSMIVADPYQGQGIGSMLLQRLLDVAAQEGLERVVAEILPENGAMRRICERLGFSARHQFSLGVIEVAYAVAQDQRAGERADGSTSV